MTETLELLAAPLIACLLFTGLHCYVGIHVVGREVIFADLALAQIAALGAASATLFGLEPDSRTAYWISLGFSLGGAVLIALGRFRDRSLPQEAVIGILYVVSAGAAVLVLDRTPHGLEELKNILVGNILFVSWKEVRYTFFLYTALGAAHFAFRRQFLFITLHPDEAWRKGRRVRLWDLLFYSLFALMVTESVKIAGVLLVFCFLIIPASGAMLFLKSIQDRLILGWILGILGSLIGLYASARWDLPTGASLVAAFGVVLALSAAVSPIFRRR